MRMMFVVTLMLGSTTCGQAQSAPPPVPVTEVIVLAVPKPGVSAEAGKLVGDEMRGLVKLYLAGKVEQMYMRADRGGVILFLRAKTVDEAKAMLADLPLVKGGFLNMEYAAVGPLMSLGALLPEARPSADGH